MKILLTTSELEVITHINEFYDSAWQKLIIAGALLIGIVGILVPLIIQFYQKKLIDSKQLELKQHINAVIYEKQIELASLINQTISENANKFKIQQDKDLNKLTAKIHHMHGLFFAHQKLYARAIQDYCIAINFFQIAGDFINVQNSIENIITDCIPYLSHNELKLFNHKNPESPINSMILRLENNIYADHYFLSIARLKETLTKALEQLNN
jgi:hypothetical protein